MIKSNELRIGNWVDLKNSGYVKVDADNIGDIVNNPAIFDPIPLTPEILEKCAFYRSHHGYWELGNDIVNICWDEAGVDIAFDGNNIANPVEYIKHLHQLQNLYFALTGEELEVTL